MTETQPAQAGRPVAVLILLFLILFVGVLDNQIILPILGAIALTFGRPVAELSWVVTVYAFSAAALNLLVAPLSDHFGRKPLLILGLLGFAAGSYGLALVSRFPTFFLLRGLMGLFAGVLSTCVTAYVGDYFPYSVRGRAMGVVMASYFAALVFGVPLGAWIADRWGWQRIFWVGAMSALILACVTAWVLPRPGHLRATRTSILSDRGGRMESRYGERYRHFLTSSEKLAVLLSGAFVSGATLALLTFISPWLTHRFGMSTSQLGLIFMVIGAGSAVASPLSGWASDHLGKRRMFLISTLVAAPLVLLIPVAPSPKTLIAMLFGTALAVALRQTSQQALVTEMISTEERGSFIALRNCFSQLGIGLSVLLASPLFDRFGFGSVAWFCATQSVLAACCFYWVREPAELPVSTGER